MGAADQALRARELRTERVVAASPAAVWAALTTPERLRRWWGPAGFTNTFSRCDLVRGGDWTFTMHGPDGADYANEARFTELVPESWLQITHLNAPYFTLDLELAPEGAGTRITWVQRFETAEIREALVGRIGNKNEENLDRLEQELG